MNRLRHYRAGLLLLLLTGLQVPLQLAVRVHDVQVLRLTDAPDLLVLQIQVICRPVTFQRAIRLGVAAVVQDLPSARWRHGSRIGDPVDPLVLLLNTLLLPLEHRLTDLARRVARQAVVVFAVPRDLRVYSDRRGGLVVARSRKVLHREHLLPRRRVVLLESVRMVMMVVVISEAGEPMGTQSGEQLSALEPLLLYQQFPIPALHLEILLDVHPVVVVTPGCKGTAADGTLLSAAQQSVDAEADLAAPRLQIRRR